MFLGKFTHSLDKEFRLAIPARFREAAGEQFAGGLCLTCGAEPCIVVYSLQRLERLLANLESDSSISKSAARDFKRALGSNAAIVVPDRLGRILIPDFLREHAGIDRDVAIVGAVDSIEIWDTATYNEREPSRRASFERLAPRVLG